MDSIKRALRKAMVSYKGLFGMYSVKAYIMVEIIGPMFQLSFFSMVATHVYGSDDISKWIIGNAMVLTYMNAFFGVGAQFIQERSMGTLKLVIAAPSNSFGIFMPRVIMHTLDGMVSVIIGLVSGALLFGFRLPLSQWIPFALVILVASFSAMGFGLLIGALGLLTRDINLLLNLASMILLAFTGANFDISKLPVEMAHISQVLPLTRSIELARKIHSGASLTTHLDLLIGEVALGLILSVIGFMAFRYLENLSRVKGTLDLY